MENNHNKIEEGSASEPGARILENYETFIHQSRYARWIEKEKRRETWDETVSRFQTFMENKYPQLKKSTDWINTISLFSKKEIVPSMRAVMTAGPALERDNVCSYNCSYLPIEDTKCFDELLYVLMCGVGVGFSVERQYINNLPEVPDELFDSETIIVVKDSKAGWASAYRQLLSLLYSSQIPKWDVSKVRAAGAPLRTFGGRASGPEPLESLFKFTIEVFKSARGRKLNSIECHDLCCKIASVVVVGGVRRSALISLSNLTDQRMAKAKSGEWYRNDQFPFRAYANNSVAYTEKPDMGAFINEWKTIYESKAGERGIFSRVAARRQASRFDRRDPEVDYGTNPCSEIILRPYQFCNLSEVIVRPDDDIESLSAKIKLATLLGTAQAGLTDFRYLRKKWRVNCEEEALLGVSLTGIADNPYIDWNNNSVLSGLRDVARKANEEYAELFGVSVSAAITCIKPSGTVSQLCGTASGLHPRYSPYYIRRVRQDDKDPLTVFLKDQGVPWEEDQITPGHTVFSFPMESPPGAETRDMVSAIDQLEQWRALAVSWAEHKPSITVYVREHEWLGVGAWVYAHWDIMSGIALLPYDDHVYAQAPYEEINEVEYDELAKDFPVINWDEFVGYEGEDNTTSSQELACIGGSCEI